MKQHITGNAADTTEDEELVIERVFDASRELVWRAWTDPVCIMRWWGPEGFTAPVAKIELRVGGRYLFCMRSPEGNDFWSTGVYSKIAEGELLVFTDSFSDAMGNVVPASYYDMGEGWPLELPVTVTFEEQDGTTKMTVRESGIPSGEMREMTGAGWNESFDKMARILVRETVSPV